MSDDAETPPSPEPEAGEAGETQHEPARPSFWRDATLQRVIAIFGIVFLLGASGFFVFAAINVAPYQADAVMKSDRELEQVRTQIEDIDELTARLEACAANFAEIRGIVPGIKENLSVIAQEAQAAFNRGPGAVNADRYIAALDAMVPLSEQAYAAYDRSCDDE